MSVELLIDGTHAGGGNRDLHGGVSVVALVQLQHSGQSRKLSLHERDHHVSYLELSRRMGGIDVPGRGSYGSWNGCCCGRSHLANLLFIVGNGQAFATQSIQPEHEEPHNWTMVSTILWYRLQLRRFTKVVGAGIPAGRRHRHVLRPWLRRRA